MNQAGPLVYWSNGLVILVGVVVLLLLFSRRIRTTSIWRATVTPLASIIGSGFLICAPLLALAVGLWSPIVMLVVVLVAYALGSCIRFNILSVEPLLFRQGASNAIVRLEAISRPILGIAYIISVAFYLKLLSVFALSAFGVHNVFFENLLTTAVILMIGISGKWRGLPLLELQEMYSVNFKLAIIVAFLVALLFHNGVLLSQHDSWINGAVVLHHSWQQAFREVLGILLIVQGFETSRYLGSTYSPTVRAKTMRYAQWISGCVYVIFILLTMPLLTKVHTVSETLIIQLSSEVALILPLLITIAGVMSQFSASVADTIGSAGLLTEATKNKLSKANAYLIIMVCVIILIWLSDIYHVIVIASKAFAVYYAFQLLMSMLALKHRKSLHLARYILYFVLFVLMLMVIAIGIPVE